MAASRNVPQEQHCDRSRQNAFGNSKEIMSGDIENVRKLYGTSGSGENNNETSGKEGSEEPQQPKEDEGNNRGNTSDIKSGRHVHVGGNGGGNGNRFYVVKRVFRDPNSAPCRLLER